MKTRDTNYIESFKEYSSKLSEGADKALLTFRRRIYIDDLNAYVRSISSETIDTGVGFLGTSIILVLPEKDKDIIAFYRDWLLAKNIRISDCYVTFHKKCSDVPMQVQTDILKKELSTFTGDCIVLNHTDVPFNIYQKEIDHEVFLKMYNMSKQENLEDQEKQELIGLKKEYWLNVREVLNYKML